MRYRDNATGIDFSGLLVPEYVKGDERAYELIFEPGVTSKDKGSGFGLFLVRRILNELDGSIVFLEHKNGVVFELTFPKAQSVSAARRMEEGA